jgi:predicted type IV restriction endonuclease
MTEPVSQVKELVERFDQNIEAYRSPAYNETQVRLEFINPLFEALGWDITNKAGYAEAYKDVLHEDAIKIGGATKAPDYSFRIGGIRKFFLEAKKPALNLKEEQSPAYQLCVGVTDAHLAMVETGRWKNRALATPEVGAKKICIVSPELTLSTLN